MYGNAEDRVKIASLGEFDELACGRRRRVKGPFLLSARFTLEDLLQTLAREQLDRTALIVARSRVGHFYKFELPAGKA